MHRIQDRRILLGVTGGIASYKSVVLARLLAQAGAQVDVVLTRSAGEFVGATTFQAVTGREVHSELFSGHALDHIRLAERAELIVVAPATADFLARMATGRADDLLAAVVLAARSPVVVAPAMNDHMWSKPATARNVASLEADGIVIIGPDVGPLAAGEGEGPGRMLEPEDIVAHVARMLSASSVLRDKRVVVTAGPTREAIDPVRYISNRSSGKMGIALARAAWRRGARVTLIAGPLSVPVPAQLRHVAVESTDEMFAAVNSELDDADVLIMAAAPADFAPAEPAVSKISKEESPVIALRDTGDILGRTAARRRGRVLTVGFALETGDAVEKGRAKLARKDMDMIVINDANEPGAGFAVDTNRVTIVLRDGSEVELPLLPKSEVAERILDQVEQLKGD